MNEQLELLIEATISASQRSRKVLILMCLASILAFVSAWNSRPNSWIKARYELSKKAVAYYSDSSIFNYHLLSKKDQEKVKINLDKKKPSKIDSNKCIKSILFDTSEINNFLRDRNVNTLEEINALNDTNKKLYEGTFQINTVFQGLPLDINDLGIYSGITFTFLLILFCFSIERERRNLQETFNVASPNNIQLAANNGGNPYVDATYLTLRRTYDYLSMQQVLTVTPPVNGLYIGFTWNILPKILYIFPFFVHMVITINDFQTNYLGRSISESLTDQINLINVSFSLLILFLTIISLSYSSNIDKTWNFYYTQIITQNNTANANNVNNQVQT